jgi:peptidoglycan/xylan/chitin deacetylase (PgdA/CDA1 family)
VLIPKYGIASTKHIWMTLDDGPHPTQTDRILKVLDSHRVKVTFFVVGENVFNGRAIIQRAFDAGHRIGNHSYSHPDLTKLDEQEISDQLTRTDALIQEFAGREKVFRPPYGAHNAVVDRVARNLGYRVVFWNVDTLDWDKQYQPDGWMQHGLDQIRKRDSCIVLNHDIHRSTADYYDMFLNRISILGQIVFEPPWTL